MKLHANAALSLNRRRRLCERVVVEGWTLTKAAEAADVSVRTARKWVRRYRVEGEAGLVDRSAAPLRQPTRTSEERVQAIAALRRLRLTGAPPRCSTTWARSPSRTPSSTRPIA